MARNPQQLRDEQDRLNALWADPPDEAPATDSADDPVASLFSTADAGAGARRDPQVDAHHFGFARARVPSPLRRPGRTTSAGTLWLGVALSVTAALLWVVVGSLTGPTKSIGASPPPTRAPAVSMQPTQRTQPDPRLLSREPRQADTRRRMERGARAGPRTRKAAPAARRARTGAPARRSLPAAGPRSASATDSGGMQRQRIIPPAVSASSACDEFPPC